jgi:exodeoxyribonuclease V alpha subunit
MNYVQGTVKIIVFHSDENSYTILKIKVTDSTEDLNLFMFDDTDYLTVTGYFPVPIRGEEIKFFGEFNEHPKYGLQYNVKNYEKLSETSTVGMVEYLSSDLFKGVGVKTAMNVVNKLGDNALKQIIDDKSVLDGVPKLNDKLKAVIYDGLIENKAAEHILIKLYDYELTPTMAMKIFKHYQNETLAIIENNPYQLIYDIEGIGFERADAIAKKLGFDEDDPLRVKAMINYLYYLMGVNYGHTFLYEEQLIEYLQKGLNKNTELVSIEKIRSYIDELIEERVFVKEDDVIKLGSIAYSEEMVSSKIKELDKHETEKYDDYKLDNLIDLYEGIQEFKYTKLQRKAIKEAIKSNIFVLTGGPGTGKTTVIKGLVFVYCKYHQIPISYNNPLFEVKLVAPTGKAAKRMNETTSLYAETIHRFLGYSYDGKFMHDKENPVEGKVIIVDEASMIDIFLASQLFQSIPKDTKVIIVGDENQLPSVGPGQVLKDIIDSEMVNVVKLAKIHRQTSDSHIIDLAYSVNEGEMVSDILKTYDDRYFVPESVSGFKNRVLNIIDYLHNQGYALYEDVQILIPMYRGMVGIDQINEVIQERFNPNKDKFIEHMNRKFMLGDKVIQLANQVEDNIMNGDQGIIVGVTDEGIVVDFSNNEVFYKKGDLINLKHAYAMSVHKSQGSEYKVVIMPIYSQYYIMLKRKLLYTGITRAKEKLILVGDLNSFRQGIEHVEATRQSVLKEKIIEKVMLKEEPKKEMKKEDWKVLNDPTLPFDFIGEELNGLSPYDFLKE